MYMDAQKKKIVGGDCKIYKVTICFPIHSCLFVCFLSSVSLAIKKTNVNKCAVLENMDFILSRDAVRSTTRPKFVTN